ncbi:MAG: hypothetical protein VX498_14365 [Myxococcota bacterium]|nr:hypothetical protein [Myxococcota bacterium]
MYIPFKKSLITLAALAFAGFGMVTSASAQPTPCDISAAVESLPTVKIVPSRVGDIAEVFGLDVIDGTADDLVPVPYLYPAAQGSIVVKITTALENARASFDVGGTFALDANSSLLEALGMKELADEQRTKAKNLASIEDPAEKNSKMAETLSDPAVGDALSDASKKVKEISADKQEMLGKAHFSGFHAGGAIALIGQDIANIILTLACAGYKISQGDASIITDIASAGLDAAVITQVWPEQVKALGGSIKAFNKTAKSNGKTLKKIYKKLKLKAPKMKPMKAAESDSAL